MTGTAEPPVLFLDVDGPLLPFGRPADHLKTAPASSAPVDHENPLPARLDPKSGARLLALGCRLVWATTWTEEANEVIAPRIGLPQLPVPEWPDADAGGTLRDLHWKTRHMVEWAAGRPFIWVDDEISTMDRLWVGASHPGPSLLHRVEPTKGLDGADFSALAAGQQFTGDSPGGRSL